MRRLLHFILSHSIFIAVCAAGLSIQSFQLVQLPINWWLIGFIFFATLGGYNAYWITSKFSFNKFSPKIFFKRQITSFVMVWIAVTGMIICMFNLHVIWYNIAITFVLLLLYVLPLLPFKALHFMRQIGFVKTSLLAFTWAHVTTLIPWQVTLFQLQPEQWWILINRFMFMLVLCIIFDKRDAAMDKLRGLHSLATDIDLSKLNGMVIIIQMIYVISCYLLFRNGIAVDEVIALAVSGIVAQIVYYLSKQKRGYIFYYFIVDGLMFLSALLTTLVSI